MWQLRGKYPNRGYPKIFQDETVGEEAKKVAPRAVEPKTSLRLAAGLLLLCCCSAAGAGLR